MKLGFFLGSIVASLFCFMGGDPSLAQGSATSGGDYIRIMFLRARADAAQRVSDALPTSIASSTSPQVAAWIAENQYALAEDIITSEHVWSETESATCARTERVKHATIQLSFRNCAATAHDVWEAQALLIHESAHHFGIEDESFCDQIALAFAIVPESQLLVGTWFSRASDPPRLRTLQGEFEVDVETNHIDQFPLVNMFLNGQTVEVRGLVRQRGTGLPLIVAETFSCYRFATSGRLSDAPPSSLPWPFGRMLLHSYNGDFLAHASTESCQYVQTGLTVSKIDLYSNIGSYAGHLALFSAATGSFERMLLFSICSGSFENGAQFRCTCN